MPVKIGHPLTDQNNAAPKPSKKSDGIMPSKSAGSVTRSQRSAHGSQYKPNTLKASKVDGTPMKGASHDSSMSGGSGPNHGKSAYGKLSSSTSVMSQALRRRSKSSSYP